MQFTPSLIAGLLVGLLNWVFWTRWGKKLVSQKELKPGAFVVVGLLKMGVLGGIIWLLLNSKYITPGGFLIGFGMVVLFIILKGFAWK